jgi:hypothetical protein
MVGKQSITIADAGWKSEAPSAAFVEIASAEPAFIKMGDSGTLIPPPTIAFAEPAPLSCPGLRPGSARDHTEEARRQKTVSRTLRAFALQEA